MPDRTIQRIQDLVTDGGKALVNGLYPNEFEYYAVTLELVDSKDQTVDYLTFPVSPNTISYTHTSVVNVKKSMGGVTVLDTSTFVPGRYMLSGTFGRSFKILVTKEIIDSDSTAQGSWTKSTQGLSIESSVLNAKIKSGYGTLKVLEAIVDKSSGLDKFNKPYRLYLYNPALGHSFLVKINSFNPNQNYQSSNMMWMYDLQMTTIAPLDRIMEKSISSSLINVTKMAVLQRGTNALFSGLKSLI